MRRHVTTAAFALIGLAAAGQAEATPFTDTTAGLTTFTAPSAGVYDIVATGAEGGNGIGGSGGLGALIGGDFYLTSGEVLTILVGGFGGGSSGAGGGGGGTFVVAGSMPLAVAGGGGGAGGTAIGAGLNVSTGTSGVTTSYAAGGDSGNGGMANGGGGGGGLLTGGADGSGAGSGGAAFLAGGAGGSEIGCCGASGGIGGGGGAADYGVGGGGGGYSGGGSGGGGGSFDAGLADANFLDQVLTDAVNGGNGEVSITVVQVPEPASVALLVTGVIGLMALRRRRHRAATSPARPYGNGDSLPSLIVSARQLGI